MFSSRHHQLGWWAQLCSVVGQLAGTGYVQHGAAPGLSSEATLKPTHYQHLSTNTQYTWA